MEVWACCVLLQGTIEQQLNSQIDCKIKFLIWIFEIIPVLIMIICIFYSPHSSGVLISSESVYLCQNLSHVSHLALSVTKHRL